MTEHLLKLLSLFLIFVIFHKTDKTDQPCPKVKLPALDHGANNEETSGIPYHPSQRFIVLRHAQDHGSMVIM